MTVSLAAEPHILCPFCPRLVDFRRANAQAHADWFNGPVPSFGDPKARLAIVGLAPGLQGANRTGRPFTGDHAGDLLYHTLVKLGFARGLYEARPDDSLQLIDCLITNAVRCVPPENKPLPIEIATCRRFLKGRLEEMLNLRAIVALGRIAHESVVKVFGLKQKAVPFAHGAVHHLSREVTLFDSFHCSRYNTNTGKLTPEMLESVFRTVKEMLTEA